MNLRRSWVKVVAKIGLGFESGGRPLTSIESLLCESQPTCEEAHSKNQNCNDQTKGTKKNELRPTQLAKHGTYYCHKPK